MEIIICQTCGSISGCSETQCTNCGASLSDDSAFRVSPIEENKSSLARNFSFFDNAPNAATTNDIAQDPQLALDDCPQEDVYVLSRSTIASAFAKPAAQTENRADPSIAEDSLVSGQEHPSSAPENISTRSSASAKKDVDQSSKARRKGQPVKGKSARSQAQASKKTSSQLLEKRPAEVKKFTGKDMKLVACIATAIIAVCSVVMFQQSDYQLEIVLFNPFDDIMSWFTKLDLAMKFMVGAASLILVSIVAIVASFKIFSPDGKANVWAKQKYIPSQFQSDHDHELKLLKQPLKPGGLPLGTRAEWKLWKPWIVKDLTLSPDERERAPHILIAGTADKGKTRLMARMITHDIESSEHAVIVVDSDGRLTDLITRWVSVHPKAEEIGSRITLLDPSSRENFIGYNPLELPDDGDLQSAAAAIVYGFKAIYTETPGSQNQWSQQTANILRNAALLLMVNGKSLTDLPTLLNDSDFRDVLLDSVDKRKYERIEHITLLETWSQYKRLARGEQWISWVEPILNRVSPMLSDVRTRSVLTKPISDLNLKKIITERRVLIVKVPKGKFDQNGNLLGSLIVTGLKQASISLSAKCNAQQPPVALYLDELDNFVEKETFESITQDTEELKIGFIGTIKTLQHLPEDFRNKLMIGAKLLCCFALTKKDADLVGPQMFRVDGKKVKNRTIQNWFNPINTSPQFEMIADEEKLNVDRLVGQNDRTFFCYRNGTVAGVFRLKAAAFADISKAQVDLDLISRMRANL